MNLKILNYDKSHSIVKKGNIFFVKFSDTKMGPYNNIFSNKNIIYDMKIGIRGSKKFPYTPSSRQTEIFLGIDNILVCSGERLTLKGVKITFVDIVNINTKSKFRIEVKEVSIIFNTKDNIVINYINKNKYKTIFICINNLNIIREIEEKLVTDFNKIYTINSNKSLYEDKDLYLHLSFTSFYEITNKHSDYKYIDIPFHGYFSLSKELKYNGDSYDVIFLYPFREALGKLILRMSQSTLLPLFFLIGMPISMYTFPIFLSMIFHNNGLLIFYLLLLFYPIFVYLYFIYYYKNLNLKIKNYRIRVEYDHYSNLNCLFSIINLDFTGLSTKFYKNKKYKSFLIKEKDNNIKIKFVK